MVQNTPPRMAALAAALFALALGRGLPAQAPVGAAYTPDRPENQGLSAEALGKITAEMNKLVAEQRLAGAELLILKNRRIVLHEIAGWRDRESGGRMARNTIFNIRSMSKLLTGLAAQTLIDDGTLAEKDKVSRFLPAFAQGPAAAITIGDLLTQRSGLPQGSGGDFEAFPSLADLVDHFVPGKLAFDPGTSFLPSDGGCDILAAIVEKASGLELQDFLERRFLGPLGMTDTFVFTRDDDPRAGRISSAYTRGAGKLTRNWSPQDGPVYRYAMGSQSFYSTPLDCARLLGLLLDGGRSGGRSLLKPAALKRILAPTSSVPFDTGFSGVRLHFGQMIQLLIDRDNLGGTPDAFGQAGSEGIVAWAWPGLDLEILFFSQTRGVRAEVALEAAADAALIHPGQESGVPAEYRPLLGKYLDTFSPAGPQEISVVYLNGRLAIDIPGQAVFTLEPPDSRGRFALSRNPAIGIIFIRDAGGRVTGLKRDEGGRELEIPRVGTPEAKEILDRIEREKEDWEKYLGAYSLGREGQNVEIVMREGSLGILRRGQAQPLMLRPPDAEGRWRFRLSPLTYLTFELDPAGAVVSFTVHTPDGQDLVRTRIAGPKKK
jgi:CubicO group peptidase (beta-lactamase class C family)